MLRKWHKHNRLPKIVVLVMVAIFIIAGFVACSKDNSKGDITITMQHSVTTAEGRAVLQDFAALYKQETGVTVDISYVPWENQRATSLAKIASGQTPDVIHTNSNQGAVEFVEMGAMSDLADMISDKMKEELVPTAFDELGTYAIPFLESPEAAVFYRISMFEEAGITPPAPGEAWTWDEFVDAAKKLTKDKNGDGVIDQWGFAERGLAGFIAMKSYIPHLFAFGTDVIVPDGDGWKSGLSEQAAKDAIAAQIALVNEHKVTPPSYVSWGLAEAIRAWGDDTVAMFSSGMWWGSTITNEFGQILGEDYDVMPFPVSKAGNEFSYATRDYFSIPTTSDSKEEAYKFIEWLMLDAKRLADLCVNFHYLPPTTKSALTDSRFSDTAFPLWSERFATWSDWSRLMPASSLYAGIWTSTIIPIWEELVTGQRSVEDGVSLMDSEVKARLGN